MEIHSVSTDQVECGLMLKYYEYEVSLQQAAVDREQVVPVNVCLTLVTSRLETRGKINSRGELAQGTSDDDHRPPWASLHCSEALQRL